MADETSPPTAGDNGPELFYWQNYWMGYWAEVNDFDYYYGDSAWFSAETDANVDRCLSAGLSR